jgi:ribosomal protein L29
MKREKLQMKNLQDLHIYAGELREKLFAHTVDAKMGKLKKIADIKSMKKEYARVQTAISQVRADEQEITK